MPFSLSFSLHTGPVPVSLSHAHLVAFYLRACFSLSRRHSKNDTWKRKRVTHEHWNQHILTWTHKHTTEKEMKMKPLSFAKVKIGIVDWFYFRRKLCNKLMSIASFCIIIPSIHIISRFGFRMLDVCLSICKHSKHILSSADYFMHFLCVLLEKCCDEKNVARRRMRGRERTKIAGKRARKCALHLLLLLWLALVSPVYFISFRVFFSLCLCLLLPRFQCSR